MELKCKSMFLIRGSITQRTNSCIKYYFVKKCTYECVCMYNVCIEDVKKYSLMSNIEQSNTKISRLIIFSLIVSIKKWPIFQIIRT